jgi:hypothetical protein
MQTHESVPARSNKVGSGIGAEEVASLKGASIAFDVPVIAIFWPNKEMGRNQDGLGRYTCNILLDRPCTWIWAKLPVYLYNIMLEFDSR